MKANKSSYLNLTSCVFLQTFTDNLRIFTDFSFSINRKRSLILLPLKEKMFEKVQIKTCFPHLTCSSPSVGAVKICNKYIYSSAVLKYLYDVLHFMVPLTKNSLTQKDFKNVILCLLRFPEQSTASR